MLATCRMVQVCILVDWRTFLRIASVKRRVSPRRWSPLMNCGSMAADIMSPSLESSESLASASTCSGGGGEGCEALGGGGINGVGLPKVGRSGRDTELVMFCGCACVLYCWGLLLRRLGRVVSGFVGIDRLCALRDAAREGAVNSYSEARARKVSPRITLSPPYSNKLTL